MKLKILAAAVASALSMGAAAEGLYNDASLGLYFKQPLGATDRQSSLASYGMQLNYSAPTYSASGLLSRPQRSLLDVRFQESQISQVKVNGLTVAHRNEADELVNSLDGGDSNTTLWWVGGALVFGAVACNQEWFGLCEDDSSYAPPGGEGAPA